MKQTFNITIEIKDPTTLKWFQDIIPILLANNIDSIQAHDGNSHKDRLIRKIYLEVSMTREEVEKLLTVLNKKSKAYIS